MKIILIAVLCHGRPSMAMKAVLSAVSEVGKKRVTVINNNPIKSPASELLDEFCAGAEVATLATNDVSPGAARNAFLESIKTKKFDFLVLLDDDDWLCNGVVERFENFLSESGVSETTIQRRWFFSDPILAGERGLGRFRKYPFHSVALHLLAPFNSVTCFIPRKMISEGCRFHETATVSEDWYFWISAIAKGFLGHYLPFGIFHYWREKLPSRSAFKDVEKVREEARNTFIEEFREGLTKPLWEELNDASQILSVPFSEKVSPSTNSKNGLQNFVDETRHVSFWHEANWKYQDLLRKYMLVGLTFVADDWLKEQHVIDVLSQLEFFAAGRSYQVLLSQDPLQEHILVRDDQALDGSGIILAARYLPSQAKGVTFVVPKSIGANSFGFRQRVAIEIIPNIVASLERQIGRLHWKPKIYFESPMSQLSGVNGPAQYLSKTTLADQVHLDINWDPGPDNTNQGLGKNSSIIVEVGFGQSQTVKPHCVFDVPAELMAAILEIHSTNKFKLSKSQAEVNLRTRSLSVLQLLPTSIISLKFRVLCIPMGNYFLRKGSLDGLLGLLSSDQIQFFSNNFVAEQLRSLNPEIRIGAINEF